MSWHYLQGQEEASWEGTCLDGAPDALLSLILTQDESCLPGRQTEACLDSRSGMTFAPLTASRGEEALTSSAVDSPAKTSASLGEASDSQESGPPSGGRCTGSFARWDPASSSWRTSQLLLTGGSMPFSDRWPTSGLMQNGVCFQRQPLELRINAEGSGSWLPTPAASMGGRNKSPTPNAKIRPSLETMARHNTWPTPTASDSTGGWQRAASKQGGANLREALGGPLNPTWVEWLMGWPIGWTDLEPLGTGRFQKWLEEHGRR